MANQVFYDKEARKRVLEGAQILYEAVKTTMGPRGRNVVISKRFGAPTVTHDGVTVAKAVDIEESDDERGRKVGAELIKQAASKLNDVAGDGTTTVTVLTYHLLASADRLLVQDETLNPMDLRRGLEAASEQVVKYINTLGAKNDISKKKEKIKEIASISAGDKRIGELIADVIEKVGKDGVVTVEEGQSIELEKEIVEGFTFDSGFVSPYMVTDTARMEAVYDKPAIVITDKKISSVQEFLPLLEKLAQSGKKDLVIIAEDLEGEALGTLILNRLKGVFNTVAVKAPSFGDRRKDVLNDIAVLTGGQVISEDLGHTFEDVDLDVVGSARKVIVSKDDTTIIEGGGSPTAIKARIKQIDSQAKAAKDSFDKEELQKRQAALSGKVAVIKVGGATETEIEEKKFRVDDAVHAVKAALAEGIVPGGGVTLINAASKLKYAGDENSPEKQGFELLKSALVQPFLHLTSNAGLNSQDLLKKVKDESGDGIGIDVTSSEGKVVTMIEEGIIDPARVTKEAVQNSVSIAGTAMTMGALVAEIPEKEPEAPAGGGMPGGMGMM